MKKLLTRYRELFIAQADDLPLFALFQIFLLTLGLLSAKARAVTHVYGANIAADKFVLNWFHALPFDLAFVAGLTLLACASRKLPRVPRGRGVLAALLVAATCSAIGLAHANVGFFTQMGRPLNLQLLALTPYLMKSLRHSIEAENLAQLLLALAAAGGALLSMPLLLVYTRPHLLRDGRWTWRPWALLAALAIGAGVLLSSRALGQREELLRGMTLVSMFRSESAAHMTAAATLSATERERVLALCGPPNTAGRDAFAAFPRRKYNVIVWVLESVGERYLKSFHPLGGAATPHLEAIAAKGCVRIKSCYSECALSVQSGWSLLTGATPPALPAVFLQNPFLPRHGVPLPDAFVTAGYRSTVMVGGSTSAWGLNRIVRGCRVDLFEDRDTLLEKGYEAIGWTIESKAIPETFWKWRDAEPQQPFFGVLWPVDTHHPYKWSGMSAADAALTPTQRYLRSIEHADRMFGAFYRELEQRQLVDDTLIVIVGDHGEGTGRRPRPYDRAHSMHVYEDALHVPLVFLHPRLKGSLQQPLDLVCSHADLVPTLQELCGLPVQSGYDGVSLAGVVPPRPLFGRSMQVWPISIRAGAYKVVLSWSQARPELFKLDEDLWEERDIAAREPDVARLLSTAVQERAAELLQSAPAK